MTPTEYERRQKQIERMRRAEDTERGRLASVLERLQKEFGVADLAAAEALQARLEKESAAAQKKADAAVGAFEAKWGERLQEAGIKS